MENTHISRAGLDIFATLSIFDFLLIMKRHINSPQPGICVNWRKLHSACLPDFSESINLFSVSQANNSSTLPRTTVSTSRPQPSVGFPSPPSKQTLPYPIVSCTSMQLLLLSQHA